MNSEETNRNDGRQVVLITGASSGIGEATARVLAQSGAHAVLRIIEVRARGRRRQQRRRDCRSRGLRR